MTSAPLIGFRNVDLAFGDHVVLAARAYKSADIFAGAALLGAIGVTANAALSLIEARALRWRGTQTG